MKTVYIPTLAAVAYTRAIAWSHSRFFLHKNDIFKIYTNLSKETRMKVIFVGKIIKRSIYLEIFVVIPYELLMLLNCSHTRAFFDAKRVNR